MRFGGVMATVFGLWAPPFGVAQANDQAANPDNYPNWRGQWYRTKGVQWDAAKAAGRGQQAPLTPNTRPATRSASRSSSAVGRNTSPRSNACGPACRR